MLAVRRIRAQVKNAPGNNGIELRKTSGLTFWTKTAWENEASLTAFSQSGAHKSNMLKLCIWCDEAVHAHWDVDPENLLSWEEAETGLKQYGRLSSLKFPSQAHKAGNFNIT